MGIGKANKQTNIDTIVNGEVRLFASPDGGVSWVAVNALENYKINDMDSASDVKYYGFEDTAGRWYIMQETTSTGAYRYVSGSSDYSTNWTGRAGLSYTLFSSAF